MNSSCIFFKQFFKRKILSFSEMQTKIQLSKMQTKIQLFRNANENPAFLFFYK